MSSVPPPAEPDGRISRIRLSSRWSYLKRGLAVQAWVMAKSYSLCLAVQRMTLGPPLVMRVANSRVVPSDGLSHVTWAWVAPES
jgi:hypothetical protein